MNNLKRKHKIRFGNTTILKKTKCLEQGEDYKINWVRRGHWYS